MKKLSYPVSEAFLEKLETIKKENNLDFSGLMLYILKNPSILYGYGEDFATFFLNIHDAAIDEQKDDITFIAFEISLTEPITEYWKEIAETYLETPDTYPYWQKMMILFKERTLNKCQRLALD